ncbi:MAG: class I SAM-dependent methyltransferase [Tissierellia bacterium]|nr:class I SAM-dependent methyltransferase [Tissierellia bacterium]
MKREKKKSFPKKIKKAKKAFYDRSLKSETWYQRLYNKVFWSQDVFENYDRKLLSKIPNDFKGKILDVPCGSGDFTYQKFSQLKNAEIHCLDYSEHMLNLYREKVKDRDHNIQFEQGDVTELPYGRESFDMIFSLNGIHAFPNKERALSEIRRVLKVDGIFLGCTYIKGEHNRADFFIRRVYKDYGLFIQPLYNRQQLLQILKRDYIVLRYEIHNSFAYFKVKKITQ